jgi:A/G-specific adenine glycosylase
VTRFDSLRTQLLDWYDDNQRDLPWRRVSDPYAIWVSEVMSQQTRVDTVIDYWQRWLQRFPDVESLAAADSDDVMRVWSGLGYYRRARYLLEASRVIVADLGGELPSTAAQLRELPGIGRYTAGAIASIAFGEAVPAVDGNVTRVVSRLFVIDGEPHRAAFRRAIESHAAELVDPARPGCSNQALMELGATVCTPRKPACLRCPVHAHCEAFATGDPEAFPPARKRKPPRPERRTTLVFIDGDGRVWMRRRSQEGLLAGLWEFPNFVADGRPVSRIASDELGIGVQPDDVQAVGEVEHVFSHIRMTYVVYLVASVDGDALHSEGWHGFERLDALGTSVAMRKVAQAACGAVEDANAGRG